MIYGPDRYIDVNVSTSVTIGEVSTTKLGFGCASLMRRSRRERMALLDTAFDSGIRHFDVARMYGLGATESVIGEFAHGRRDQVTIATKFGLDVSSLAAALAPYQAPFRAALERLPNARRSAKQQAARPAAPRTYSADDAKRSLEVSLSELKTDYVDMFFIHDPSPGDDIRTQELLEFFNSAHRAGKIRSWGISQDAHPGMTAIDDLGTPAILQVRTDIFSDLVVERPSITFGVIGNAYARVISAFARDATMRARWSRTLDLDLNRSEVLAELLLGDALAQNDRGVVLYSTLNEDRLRHTASLTESRTDSASITRFRELVRTELANGA